MRSIGAIRPPPHRAQQPAVFPGCPRSRGMFDANGNALPVLSVFDKYTRGKPPARKP